jgi:putative transcriptional regulator
MPSHHIPEPLLVAYAAGAVSEGESLLIATHAALCPGCTAEIARLEELGGALLSNEAPSALSTDLLARTLGKLEQVAPAAPARRSAGAPRDALLPAPLSRIVGPYESIRWKRAFDGLYYVDLPLQHGAVPVRLRRLGAGMRVPVHTHRGAELELVLAGGAVDEREGRRFLRGDVAYNDENDTHSLRVDDDGECLVLGVQDARLAPKSLWSRLVFGYLRW